MSDANDREMLSVSDLRKHYPIRGGVFGGRIGALRAVDGVTLSIASGQTLGLVGESGCGKSTLGRTLIRLEEPTGGRVVFEGRDLAHLSRHELLTIRREMQMIFQDPYSSLNPRMTVGEIVREPLIVHRVGTRAEQVDKVRWLFEKVGLSGDMLDRYPHEFSGGQRQRVGIARALALEPKFVIADEPVSALDVSVQSQVLNLMLRLQRDMGLTYLFISHDLSVVDHVSDTIAVMYLGRIVEQGSAEGVFSSPIHPYTRTLLEAAPEPDPRRRGLTVPIKGEAPSPVAPPSGCPYHPRCAFAVEDCRAMVPPLEPRRNGAKGARVHLAACIRKDEI
ncbi:MAG TPA: oligopeptide/dipeptide ABC transporter ATP-binding protein [Burkholderiales bacterium]|nr:oligopeptide/dipeptide ABC transporter ATP-binding protein [Burkholderiales bacterium]